MKKTTMIVLTMALIAALFTGCRRPQPATTGSTAGSTPAATTVAPTTTAAPSTTTTVRPEPSMTLPDATDILPSGTSGATEGNDMTRGRMGPRM